MENVPADAHPEADILEVFALFCDVRDVPTCSSLCLIFGIGGLSLLAQADAPPPILAEFLCGAALLGSVSTVPCAAPLVRHDVQSFALAKDLIFKKTVSAAIVTMNNDELAGSGLATGGSTIVKIAFCELKYEP